MEGKIVVDGQLALAYWHCLSTWVVTVVFIRDEPHSILPEYYHLAEVMQECDLIDQGFGESSTGITFLESFN